VLSHPWRPWRKDKDAPWMGHPDFGLSQVFRFMY
jgi:hypothetical protein